MAREMLSLQDAVYTAFPEQDPYTEESSVFAVTDEPPKKVYNVDPLNLH